MNPLIEELARNIYCDSYTQYGTCSLEHWTKTSETQKKFCRSQIQILLNILSDKGLLNASSIKL